VSDKIWENISTINLPFILGEPEIEPHSYNVQLVCDGGEFVGNNCQEFLNRGDENEDVK
jgi:hypothetical protein